LVKDGATAIAALGQDIDTALVDLKGGTTGQVLAKASNTDLDYSWVAQDDSNAIQNAIVDAKGDLIAATANDTPARLAVGANDLLLTAASGETTGLKWAGSWSNWTPSVANISLGNGTLSARYAQVGKVVHFNFKLTFGSTTTISGSPNISLPVTPSKDCIFNAGALDVGTAWYNFNVATSGATAYFDLLITNSTYLSTTGATGFSATVPFTWTTNDAFVLNGSYEVA
jgi:hypothetical protein